MSLSAKKLLATAIIPFALTACGKDPTANDHVSAQVYRTVEECLASQNGTASLESCRAAFKSAKDQHMKEAPRFASKRDCEADFGAGRCGTEGQATTSASLQSGQSRSPQEQTAVARHDDGSFFVPFMYGYILSNMRNGSGGGGHSSAPVYQTSNNRTVTPSGHEYHPKSGTIDNAAFTKHGSPTVVPAGKSFNQTSRYQPSSLGKSRTSSAHGGSHSSRPSKGGSSSRSGGFRGGGFGGGR